MVEEKIGNGDAKVEETKEEIKVSFHFISLYGSFIHFYNVYSLFTLSIFCLNMNDIE